MESVIVFIKCTLYFFVLTLSHSQEIQFITKLNFNQNFPYFHPTFFPLLFSHQNYYFSSSLFEEKHQRMKQKMEQEIKKKEEKTMQDRLTYGSSYRRVLNHARCANRLPCSLSIRGGKSVPGPGAVYICTLELGDLLPHRGSCTIDFFRPVPLNYREALSRGRSCWHIVLSSTRTHHTENRTRVKGESDKGLV